MDTRTVGSLFRDGDVNRAGIHGRRFRTRLDNGAADNDGYLRKVLMEVNQSARSTSTMASSGRV